jgi:hypothetical protein
MQGCTTPCEFCTKDGSCYGRASEAHKACTTLSSAELQITMSPIPVNGDQEIIKADTPVSSVIQGYISNILQIILYFWKRKSTRALNPRHITMTLTPTVLPTWEIRPLVLPTKQPKLVMAMVTAVLVVSAHNQWNDRNRFLLKEALPPALSAQPQTYL